MQKIIESHYRKNKDRLVKKLSYRAGTFEDAEDVVQTAYYRAIRWQHSFNNDANAFERWFYSILNNSLKEFKRYQRGEALAEFDEEAEEGVGDPTYTALLSKEIMHKIMNKEDSPHGLPISELLTFYFIHNLRPKEISSMMGININTVNQTIQRFKNELET
jgi:RNA polymerase sigma factor (sigma-70 family)